MSNIRYLWLVDFRNEGLSVLLFKKKEDDVIIRRFRGYYYNFGTE